MDSIKSYWANLDQKSTLGIIISSILGHILTKKLRSVYKENKEAKKRPLRLVVITGCDSGLGLSMAHWATKLGYKVFAGCLNPNGEGANYLRRDLDTAKSIQIAHLDVTDEQSIDQFRQECQKFLDALGDNTRLWAVVSNAAVLVCGESFWQTSDQREIQMKVNFWGTLNLVNAFQPLLFQYKSRLIITTSDCAQYALPGLAVYGASKAAQEAWARGLRLEVAKYGVSVVCYQPGSFPKNSNIFANSESQFKEMESVMKESDKEFYGEYFQQWKQFKSRFSKKKTSIAPFDDNKQRQSFVHLLEGNIRYTPVYKYTTLAQKIIHSVEDYLPHRLSDPFLRFIMDASAKWIPSKISRLR